MRKTDFVLKNRAGKRIQSTIRIVEGKPKGTVVLLHGLGGWKEQPLLVIVADAIAAKGYNVLTFDAADGAKGPDADFLYSTTSGYLDDIHDVIAHMKQEEWYKGPLIIAGHSLGGLAALHYTRLHPAEISKLILFAPAVSWKSELTPLVIGVGVSWFLFNKNKTPGPNHSWLPLDKSFLKDFMKYDMRRDAPYVSAPTLIISASKDKSVAHPKAHFKLAQRFPNALTVVIPGAGHVFWKHERQVGDTITQWLTSS